MIEKIRACYNALELPFNEEVIDRARRVGKEYTDKILNKVESIIVKFISWKARQKLYNACRALPAIKRSQRNSKRY